MKIILFFLSTAAKIMINEEVDLQIRDLLTYETQDVKQLSQLHRRENKNQKQRNLLSKSGSLIMENQKLILENQEQREQMTLGLFYEFQFLKGEFLSKNLTTIRYCDPEYRKLFVPSELVRDSYSSYILEQGKRQNQENLTKKESLDNIEMEEQCYDLIHNCCNLEELSFLKTRAQQLIKKFQRQMRHLVKIIFYLKNKKAHELMEKIQLQAEIYHLCNPISDSDFSNALEELMDSMIVIKKRFKEYMDKQIQIMHNQMCDFCDARFANDFYFNYEEQKYVDVIKVPDELKKYRNKLADYDQFHPLIAFGNMLKCVMTKQIYGQSDSRNMKTEYANKISVNESINEHTFNKFKYELKSFEDLYMPNQILIPDFENISDFIKVFVKENYKKKMVQSPNVTSSYQQSVFIETIFKRLGNSKVFENTRDHHIFLYSNTQGYESHLNHFMKQKIDYFSFSAIVSTLFILINQLLNNQCCIQPPSHAKQNNDQRQTCLDCSTIL